MTPAINIAHKNKIAHQVHQYHHDASSESYGLEIELSPLDLKQLTNGAFAQLCQ